MQAADRVHLPAAPARLACASESTCPPTRPTPQVRMLPVSAPGGSAQPAAGEWQAALAALAGAIRRAVAAFRTKPVRGRSREGWVEPGCVRVHLPAPVRRCSAAAGRWAQRLAACSVAGPMAAAVLTPPAGGAAAGGGGGGGVRGGPAAAPAGPPGPPLPAAAHRQHQLRASGAGGCCANAAWACWPAALVGCRSWCCRLGAGHAAAAAGRWAALQASTRWP